MKFNSVVTNIQQDFTAPEKALGRSNIGAASQEDLVSVSAAIPDLAGYATESYVDEAVSSVTALFPEEQELVAGDNVSITVSGSSAIISASGGASYSAGQYVSISGDTISVTGLQPAGSYALESELQIVSAAIPSLSGYATEQYVDAAVSSVTGMTGNSLFPVVYGTTTFAEIKAAYAAGKLPVIYLSQYTTNTGRAVATMTNYFETGSGKSYIEFATPHKRSDTYWYDSTKVYTLTREDPRYHNPPAETWSTEWWDSYADWNAVSGMTYIRNKPDLSIYATEQYVDSAYTAGNYISVNGGVIAVTGLQPPDIYADYQIPQEEAMVFSLTAEDIAASGHIIDFQFREAPATNVILGNAMVSLVWWINYTGGVAKNIVDKIYFILRNTQSGSYTWNCITCSDVKDSQWDKDWNCIDSSHLRVKYNQLRVNIALKPEAQVGDTFQFLLGGFVKDIRA